MRKLAVLALLGAAAAVLAVVAWGSGDLDPVDLPGPRIPRPDLPETPNLDAPAPRRSTCPPGLPRCREVSGRIVLVEAVDRDGDGDLHVVVAAGGITAPGVTSVDVAPALRPARNPRIGDKASAAGQVQRGSYGQSQIHAEEFHVSRRRGP